MVMLDAAGFESVRALFVQDNILRWVGTETHGWKVSKFG